MRYGLKNNIDDKSIHAEQLLTGLEEHIVFYTEPARKH